MMRKSFFSLIFLLSSLSVLWAQTQVSGTIDGETWTKAGSPYLVTGKLTVLQLTIEPGVQVLFSGNYNLKVDGELVARGTASDSIIFASEDGNASGWKGLLFSSTASDQCELAFVRISGVSGNSALSLQGGTMAFEHVRIVGNSAKPVSISGATLRLTRCDILDNDYGVDITSGGSLELIACRLLRSGDSGIETNDGTITLTNSIVASSANEGILLSATGDQLEATNSVIAYNGAEGILATDGVITVENSIIFFNQALNQIYNVSGTPEVSYSDVDQPNLGTTNLMTDPLFADTLFFHLQENSPVIDQGNPDTDVNDLYFPPSLGSARNDMGAYGGPYARKWYPAVFVRPDSLPFGDVSLGDSLQKVVTLKNYGDNTMTVQSILLQGADADQFKIPEFSLPLSLPMADSLRIPVTFSPTKARIAPFQAHLALQSDLGEASVPLTGRGVVPDIFVLPDQLDFGTLSVGQRDSLQIKIYNLGTDTLRIDSLKCATAKIFSFKLNASTLEPSASFPLVLTVYFAPDTLALYRDSLAIYSNDPDESPLHISVQGEGTAPVIAIAPKQVQFDSVMVNRDGVRTVVVKNTGNEPLTITQIGLQNSTPNFSWQVALPLTVAAGDSATLSVTFRPDSIFAYADSLLFQSNDPFHPQTLVPLAGQGIAAYAVFSSGSLNFGTIIAPHDSTMHFNIRNSGNIPLHITEVAVRGTDAASFTWWKSPEVSEVEPQNDSLKIYVRCTPQKHGTLHARLVVRSDDVRRDSSLVPLTALVKAAKLGIDADTVRFSGVVLFQTARQVIHVFNEGDFPLTIDSMVVDTDAGDLHFPALTFPVTLRPQVDTLSYPVQFVPQHSGVQQAQVAIYSNDPFQNPKVMQIRAEGVEPKLSVRPDSLDFGAISIFRIATDNLCFKNTGDAPVVIDSLVLRDDALHAFWVQEVDHPTLPAGSDSLLVPVRFQPSGAGSFHARLLVFWNNPYHEPEEISLHGRADSAHVSLPDSLDFGTITVHSGKNRQFMLKNRSKVRVLIDSLKIVGNDRSQFRVLGDSLGVVLEPEDTTYGITVRYEPHSVGWHQAELRLYSQDIREKVLRVSRTGVALFSADAPLLGFQPQDSLRFGAVFLSEERILPFLLINKGNSSVTLDSLFISGERASAFKLVNEVRSTVLLPGDTLKNALSFAPTQATAYRAWLNGHTDNAHADPQPLLLCGSGKIDPTPAQVDFNPDTVKAVAGKDLWIAIRVSDDSTSIRKAELRCRVGGESEFRNLLMQSLDAEKEVVAIPADWVTARGLEIYFVVYHGGAVTEYPQGGAQNALNIPVHISQMVFPQVTRREQYQMISLPCAAQNQTLENLFKDDLGSYDPAKYRFFDWDASSKQFREIDDLQMNLAPGKAVYLITKDSLTLDVENVQSVPIDEDFELTLHAGWNMIGDPFSFAVDWQSVEKEDAQLTLFYYNGNGWEVARQLQPFKGYAVFCSQAQTLKIPPVEAAAPLAKVQRNAPPAVDNVWQFRILARSAAYFDTLNTFGVAPEENVAAALLPELPVIGKYVSLYFPAHDSSTGFSRLTRDFRAQGKTGYVFDFTVESTVNQPIELEFVHDSLPQGWQWSVVNPGSGVHYTAFPLRLHAKKQTLRVLVGTADFVQQALQNFRNLPRHFCLHQNYPNPFNSTTVFQVDLPRADKISVRIFDVTGRKIRTLIAPRLFDPGYYRFKWDGRTQNGRPAASGIYFVQIRGKQFVAAKKMVLQK